MKTKTPGLNAGIIMGTLFLIVGLVMWALEPNFTGFFNRGHDASAMSIWMLLLVLAVVNYVYGFFSLYIQRKAEGVEAPEQSSDPGQAD